MPDIWFVRAGKENMYAEEFLQKGMVAIGWVELGDVALNTPKTQAIQSYQQLFPDHSDGRAQVAVSQIIRFIQEVKINDEVLTYDRDKQIYYLGVIKSECIWQPDVLNELPRVRSVEWMQQVVRSSLSSETKNSLGAIQTLFQLKGKSAAEISLVAIPLQSSPITVHPPIPVQSTANQVEAERAIRIELLEKSDQAIEDRIVRLDWEQVQELVAGILRAMGYRTTVSPRGSDRGVDIFASPDGLGLEEPRIFVEVKHKPNTSIGSHEVRSFLGGRSSRDKCLYVSTGGFTKESRYEADRANVPLNLLGLVDLRKLFVEYYDKIDENVRSLIPLKRIYVLAD